MNATSLEDRILDYLYDLRQRKDDSTNLDDLAGALEADRAAVRETVIALQAAGKLKWDAHTNWNTWGIRIYAHGATEVMRRRGLPV